MEDSHQNTAAPDDDFAIEPLQLGTDRPDAYGEPYDRGAQPQKRMSGWQIALLVVLALIVLCCLCAIAVVAVLALLGPAVGNTFSTVIEGIMTVTPMP